MDMPPPGSVAVDGRLLEISSTLRICEIRSDSNTHQFLVWVIFPRSPMVFGTSGPRGESDISDGMSEAEGYSQLLDATLHLAV